MASDGIFTDDEILAFLAMAVAEIGRGVSPTAYQQFRLRHKEAPDAVVITRRFGSWSKALRKAIALIPTPESVSKDTKWTAVSVANALKKWNDQHPERMYRSSYPRFVRKFHLPPVNLVLELISEDWDNVMYVARNWRKSSRLLNGTELELRQELLRIQSSNSKAIEKKSANAEYRLASHLEGIPDL